MDSRLTFNTSSTNATPYPSSNELIQAILHGNITKGFPEPPSRIIKIFISSTKSDFEYERQHLHEVVLPKLERYCNSLSFDLLAIDPHWQQQPLPSNAFGQAHNDKSCSLEQTARQQPCTVMPIVNDPNSNCYIDPHEFDLQLNEIEECSEQSLGTFFMCLIGHKYRPIALPTIIASNDFQQIFTAAAESGLGDVNLLRSCYKENKNLHPEPYYVLLEPRRASRQYEEELGHIAKLVEYGSKVAAREGLLSSHFGTVMSAVHQQTLHALYSARQYPCAGKANSPTQRNHTSANLLHRVMQPNKKNSTLKCPNSKLTSIQDGDPLRHEMDIHTNQHADMKKCPSPQMSRCKSSKLIHQVSLQQAPTQQKINMPRQTSFSANYDLLQEPVDRILCFIRQLEGVNFNNSFVCKFFDVTPTTVSNISSSTTSDECRQQLNASPIPIINEQQQQPENSKQAMFAPTAQNDIQQLIEDVILGLKKGNVHYFNISWNPPSDNNYQQTRTYTLPANYIEKFGDTVLQTLKNSIEQHLAAMQQSVFGPLNPGSNVEYPGDIVREAHSHLSNFRRVMRGLGMAQAINHSDFGHLLHIRELLISDIVPMPSPVSAPGTVSRMHQSRHQPIIVTGIAGSGKSTLLAQVFTYAPEWLSKNSDRDLLIRIVRQCGKSPSSNFASELLRSLCIQISIAYGLEAHLSRSTAAHELSELAICFQELLKLRNNSNCDLLIILDDLHYLQSALQSSALLGWMPWNLPSNVHFICSVALESESVLSILRSRISSENFICLNDHHIDPINHFESIFSMVQSKLRDEKRTLTPIQWDFVREKLQKQNATNEMTPLFANLLATSVLSSWESFYTPEHLPTSVNELVSTILDDLEECLPCQLVRRICSYLTCTKYGLREAELFNLVQETLTCQIWTNQQPLDSTAAVKHLNDNSISGDISEQYNPHRSTASTWLILKYKMKHLLTEYFVQGKLYLNWRSSKIAKAVKERYLFQVKQIRATHFELATAFSNSFTELSISGKLSESVREADEFWYHLLYSGNKSNLKSQALLNIHFLNVIVQGVSVCYLRCILDAIRSQILDWDIEQLYAMLKQSVFLLTQEPTQLAVEVLQWLVPFSSPETLSLNNLLKMDANKKNSAVSLSSSYLIEFLRQCYRSCVENANKPLLYPLNVWLNLPTPPQITMITSPWPSITRAVSTPDSQHLIVCEGKWLHFYHLPTKTIAKSLDEHESMINCLHLSQTSQWLITGSEDSSVNVWLVDAELMEINDCRLCHTFHHHNAAVLCVITNQAETLVISGSENGTICAVNLHNGTLITRLEHHKSMVTCISINFGDDVLVSGSTDCTVVVWSLETFCILNEILLMRPVLHMDISLDSTFLLLSLDDNSLQIRALTTGTNVHTLQPVCTANTGTSAVISYVRFAEDNCRCVVGYADGRLILFDIHSARQLQTLSGHSEMITSILPQKDDKFLITSGGNKIIIWNFYPVKRVDQAGWLSELAIQEKSIHESNAPTDAYLLAPSAGQMTAVSESLTELSLGCSTASARDPKETGSSSGRSSRSSSDRRKHKSTSQGTLKKKSFHNIENHREPITCVCVARDGQYIVTGGKDCLVKIWHSATAETHTTLDDNNSPITCLDISPNSQLVVFGSEDGQLRTWSLTLLLYLSTLSEHSPHSLAVVKVLSDNKRALSADLNNTIRLWQIDNGTQIKVLHHKPITGLHIHGGTCFAIGGKIDNCLKYWQVYEPETEKSVSHSDTITCFTCTHSGKTIITGSQDMSLKIWETATGKLIQVLAGHEEAISCVATAALDDTLVVSGAQDCNLIVWDMNTGTDLYTLTGHNANVLGVILTPDGARALSYSEDNTLQLWDIKENGVRLSMLDMHHNIAQVYSSLNVTFLAVWLGCNSQIIPIIKHHNNPSHNVFVELPAVGTPVLGAFEEKSSAWLRGLMPSRNASALAARTLKREQSFDSFYFEHMLHRGQSVDDFRKIGIGTGLASSFASPFGSREQLWTGGHDESKTMITGSSTRNRMISKLMNIGPKQKMLKKQQSMFACFPEFTAKISASATSTSNPIQATESSSIQQQPNGTITKTLLPSNKKIFPLNNQVQLSGRSLGMSSRTGSQDKDELDELKSQTMVADKAAGNLTKDSSICSVI